MCVLRLNKKEVQISFTTTLFHYPLFVTYSSVAVRNETCMVNKFAGRGGGRGEGGGGAPALKQPVFLRQ